MGKRSLKRKYTRKRRNRRNKRNTIQKKRYIKSQKKHKRSKKYNKSKKVSGGGNFNIHKLIPQDIVSVWRGAGDGISKFYHQAAGKPVPQSSSPVSQPYLKAQKMPIPQRTNIQLANQLADNQVNQLLN